jgi:hypothetical protein
MRWRSVGLIGIGVIIGLVLGPVIVVGLTITGIMPVQADATPPRWAERIAHHVLRSSVHRQSPAATNPLRPTDDILLAGLKLYRAGCAGCHGDRKPAVSRS